MFHRSFEMYFPDKLTHYKPLILSQEQRNIIEMVSTQLGKKDIIIFGKTNLKGHIWVILSWLELKLVLNLIFQAILVLERLGLHQKW